MRKVERIAYAYAIVRYSRMAFAVAALLLAIAAMLTLHGCSSQQQMTAPQLTIGADSAGCAITVEGYGTRIRQPLPPVVCTSIPGVLVIQLSPYPTPTPPVTGE